MNRLRRSKLFILAAVLALPCAYLGCSHSKSSGSGGTGIVAVQVTDAPFPFTSVTSAKVTLTEVSLQGTTSQGFVTVFSGNKTLDLLQLQNGLTATLTSAAVPAGSYNQMRVVIDSGSITLTDGRTFNLNAPSGSASGLKVFITPPLTVVSGVSQDLLLDIDLAQSFQAVPNGATQASTIANFQFHPVVRVANVSTVGRIGGTVTANTGGGSISGATVTASQNGTTIGTAQTATDGSYAILGLAPGTYTVSGDAVGFVATSSSATVAAGSVSTVNLALGP